MENFLGSTTDIEVVPSTFCQAAPGQSKEINCPLP